MVYYSALHWAKKAEASAEAAADSASQVADISGKIIQVGFDGTLANGVLTFKHAPGGVEVPYNLQDDFEYELDLVFANTADLPTNTQMVIKNGNDTIRFVSALHRDATTNATVADMDAVMRFNSSTGYRWLFKAAYKVTPSGAKVFLLYPVVAKEDTTKITNCITEIPQDIKLELVDGTLTLKAGSKVYVPNGKNADGSLKFDVVTIPSDKTSTRNLGKQEFYVYHTSSGKFNQWQYGFSGGTVPTLTNNYAIWYDTTNNLVKHTTDKGVTWISGCSLPVCLSTSNTTQITSIDQVFNGFGRIGSTVFALPGVKGLIPNGRNEDGTLKNIEMVISEVKIKNASQTSLDNGAIIANINGSLETTIWLGSFDSDPQNVQTHSRYYNTRTNFVRFLNSSREWINQTNFGEFGNISIKSNTITSLTPKPPFKAADYQDVMLKQDIATAVNYDNITNCITEIPQDIKLELNNGTLTLKAGSVLYEPSGVGNFIKHTTTQDQSWAWGTGQFIILPQKSGNMGQTSSLAKTSSGATAPSNPSNGDVWYDTTNNIIKRYGTSWVAANFCLPIAITTNADSTITSIDQTFNGFGYIGSTVFALPGVKGLIPDGRNEDGTLKNVEFTVDKVLIRTITDTGTRNNVTVGFSPYRGSFFGFSLSAYYDRNTNFNKEGGNDWSYVLVGNASYSATKLTSFTPKLPFRAADDQEVAKLAGENVFTGNNTFTSPVKTYRVENEFTDGSYADIFFTQNVNGTVFSQLRTKLEDQTSNNWMGIQTSAAGVTTTRAPTPAVSDNSAQIATTNYVNQKIQVVSALPASPNASVFYCLPE